MNIDNVQNEYELSLSHKKYLLLDSSEQYDVSVWREKGTIRLWWWVKEFYIRCILVKSLALQYKK